MSAYQSLARSYDRLTQDVDYRRWLDWYLRWFRGETPPVSSVVDLGCGTGTLTCLLAQAGYAVTGVDLSEDMLTQAMDKALALPEQQRPLLVCQSMDALRLPCQADAVVCSLDCLNYLTRRTALRRTLRGVCNALRPGGLFLFDVIPLWELERRDGEVFVDEDEETLCLWRADWNRRRQVLTYGMDLFSTGDGVHWSRSQEEHQERGWALEELEALLAECGFALCALRGENLRSTPGNSDSRVFFVCRKSNE